MESQWKVIGGNGLVEKKRIFGIPGYIVIARSPGAAPIEVSLIWDQGEGDKKTVLITMVAHEFIKVPLKFSAGKTTGRGRLEIVSRKRGAFRIGTVSLMPADNVKGFRADVLSVMKELNATIYR